jgi:thioredoxin reductase
MKPDVSKLSAIYDALQTTKRQKEKEGEALVASLFKIGMHISAIKYSSKEGKDIRVSGVITHIGEGSQWYFMRMLLDLEWREYIKQNNWAPDNEVWLAASDPDEDIEVLDS